MIYFDNSATTYIKPQAVYDKIISVMKNEVGHRIDIVEVIKVMNTEKENLIVKGIEVSYKKINEEDYICLTDIAKVKIPNTVEL